MGAGGNMWEALSPIQITSITELSLFRVRIQIRKFFYGPHRTSSSLYIREEILKLSGSALSWHLLFYTLCIIDLHYKFFSPHFNGPFLSTKQVSAIYLYSRSFKLYYGFKKEISNFFRKCFVRDCYIDLDELHLSLVSVCATCIISKQVEE